MTQPLLEVKDLTIDVHTPRGTLTAVSEISFDIAPGETVCLVGESGSGKTIASKAILRLTDYENGSIAGGSIRLGGDFIQSLPQSAVRSLRGRKAAMIFQEPMSSLNPVFTIGKQITEPLLYHLGMTQKEAKARAIELITLVGIPRPEKIFDSYPHELSGGMRQRIMIAIALSCNPKLLIADEPTTALDVTIQAQILDLMRDIKSKLNTAIMMITHDLGVVAEMADFVVVMYAGKVIEEAPVLELFRQPKHPYTQGLLKAKPVINQRQERLYSIPGQVPNPVDLGDNCHFHDRCEFCMEICKAKTPPLRAHENGHKTACWLYEEEGKAQ